MSIEIPFFPSKSSQFKHLAPIKQTLFGNIELVCDEKSLQQLALKRFDKARIVTTQSNVCTDDVYTEIACMLRLREHPHPSIVELVDYWEEESSIFIAYKYYDRGDLFDYISNNQASTEQVKSVLLQLLSAMEHLWSLGIIHRDISLENVMITSPKGLEDNLPVIKLIDFGGAFLFDPSNNIKKKVSSTGKIGYIAPEMLKNAELEAGEILQADMYSLGVFSFILFLGSPPYRYPTFEDKYFAMFASFGLDYVLQRFGFDSLLTGEAKDFVHRLMNLVPSQRLTLREAKTHACLCDSQFPISIRIYLDTRAVEKAVFIEAPLDYWSMDEKQMDWNDGKSDHDMEVKGEPEIIIEKHNMLSVHLNANPK